MTTSVEPVRPGPLEPMPPAGFESREEARELAASWRTLTRAATFVAILTCPALVVFFMHQNDWPFWKSLLISLTIVIVFRGFVDLVLRRTIPSPSLFGLEADVHREEDVLARRRVWFWRFWFKIGATVAIVVTIVWLFQGDSWTDAAASIWDGILNVLSSPSLWIQVVFVFFLFIANFAILMGPLLLMNLAQMQAFEPGDAQWGVKLGDVRGQAEAKEEVRRVVSIWQSGEAFERAGGKRERGLLFLGAPGTGKTMLAKAIATGFNSPFISMPGSGFAATFIGIDAIVVRILARRAKKLARKWGGQCIVFIDEIDAVGRRRQALQSSMPLDINSYVDPSDFCFFGPWGARNPSGDVIVESARWRERLFEQRAPQRLPNPLAARIGNLVNQFPGGMFGGMGGGQLALNQLLVVMDGIDNPPFMRRVLTSRVNTLLDASYVIPRRIRKIRLRIPAARPRGEQIYFIGATNVPLDVLDPALTRPGRMGRHVQFRTPTKDDRKDVFDLYLGKVAHDADLDTPKRRDEIARITSGYSPAMIDQICSMALTNAQHEGQISFSWEHLVQSMTTLEAGSAVNINYVAAEQRATAIHEAGHATTAHVYRPELESSRLSIRMRGRSLGHHQAFQREERFSVWQREQLGDLIHGLGAMAAENVFYGENTNGVGGDLQSATEVAAWMVGTSGMRPERVELGSLAEDETEDEARERIMKRFERIGLTLMNRTRGSADFHSDPIASVLGDPYKRQLAAQILGQAYVIAYNFIVVNKESVDGIALRLVDKREIFGDDLLELLDRQQLVKPELDYTKEETWPKM